MLGSIVRVVKHVTPKKVARCPRPNSGIRSMAATWKQCSRRPKWRVYYSNEAKKVFDPQTSPEMADQETPAIDLQEVANMLSQKPLSADEMRQMGRTYTQNTGKPLIPPPVTSEDPKTHKLNGTIAQLLQTFEYDKIRATWLVALKDKVVPDNETFTLLIRSFVQAKTYALIAEVEQQIEILNIPMTLNVFNALLYWCAETGNHAKADTMWKKVMQIHNVNPDIRSIDYYMQAHSFHPEHFNTVVEVFKEYPKMYDLQVDTEMQGSLIAALLRNEKEDLAMRRWEAMKSGKLPAPTNKTINLMMSHFAAKGQEDRVQELFDSFTTQWGLYPDKDSYAVLMEMKMKKGEFDEVKDMVWKLCAEGWPIAPHIITNLMSHYEHTLQDGATVEQLWALIPKAKISPDILMLTVLMSSCLRVGKVDRAIAYLAIARDRYQLAPNRMIYAALIGSLGRKEQLSRAMNLYKDMISRDKILPGPTTFVALLRAYAANGQVDGIKRMLKNPANHGIPNINRAFFEEAIYALENGHEKALASLERFDWTRLEGVTSETREELRTLNGYLYGDSE